MPPSCAGRNYLKPEQFPYKTPTGSTYDTGDYETNLSAALSTANYEALRAEQAERRADGSDKLLGIGLATYVEMCGFGPYESGQVRVEPSGTVTVYTGTSPHGQGLQTTFAQIVADEIGADYDKVIVRHGDTGSQPVGVGTFGSRSLAIGGSAIVRSAGKVRDKAIQIAAHMLEASPGDIEFAEGEYRVKGVPSRSLSLDKIAARAYSDRLPDDIDTGLEATDFFRPADLSTPSVPMSLWSRSRRTLASSVSANSTLSMTAVRASARCWSKGRFMAVWRKASARRCWKKSSSTIRVSCSLAP